MRLVVLVAVEAGTEVAFTLAPGGVLPPESAGEKNR